MVHPVLGHKPWAGRVARVGGVDMSPSPTPWHKDGFTIAFNNDTLGFRHAGSVCTMAGESALDHENARLIVKAVNHYEATSDLLSALKACLKVLRVDSDMEEDFQAEIQQAQAAIANAEGGKP